MKRWIVAVAFMLVPFAAGAATRAQILKQVEASMLVKGTLDIGAEGSVTSLVLDQPEKLPAGIADFVQKQVMTWKFEPVLVDGKPVRARSPMSMRVVARVVDKDSYSIAIRNASFEGEAPKPGETVSRKKITPPRYPEQILRSGASGSVYVVAKVTKDGHVVDAVVEQVNLRTIGTAREMASWRNALADATLKAVRGWTYTVPSIGELADDEFWLVRVPVDFKLDNGEYAYGSWDRYIPGPRQTLPWSSEEERHGFSPDSLAAGGDYLLGSSKGPKLLTPLGGS